VTPARALPFQLTVAIGAFLLFLVQPMAARFVLPWFGGAPAVWSTSLLFFQTALLAGYLYAHLTRRLGAPKQARVHLALLALAILTLPIAPSPSWKPVDGSAPAFRILVLLSATVGLPYVLLAATAPMVQDWFARIDRSETAGDGRRAVYWLYALSNLGSLIGLLAYPSAIERFLSLRAQAWFWSAGFVFFGAACAWTARQVMTSHRPAADAPVDEPAPALRTGDVVMWLTLSFCGTGMLLAVTNELCQDVAVVPLLWVVPLTLYLLTFIVCFSGFYRRSLWACVLLATTGAVAWMIRHDAGLFAQSGAILALLFAGCMVCHGEIVAIRPHTGRLTAFYLAIAAGGSLGGVAVALVAPVVLDRLWEFQFFALLPTALLLVALFRDRESRAWRGYWRLLWVPPVAVLGAAGFALVKPPASDGTKEIARTRNFYGVLTVLDDDQGSDPALRRLRNGRILHGAQFQDPARRREVTTYYGDGSGVQLAIDHHPKRDRFEPLRIGAVGLGAGTIAALGREGDTVRFFEINPAAVDFAKRYFWFLNDSDAKTEIALGDARLSIERELRDGSGRHAYDVIAVDAFSGDAIPVHLLTREAFALYVDALREDGVLAVHVSNHYLDLPPIVRGLAAELGKQVLLIETDDDILRGLDSSTWMLVTANAAIVEELSMFAQTPDPKARTLVWTDSFSSLLQVLKRE